MEKYFEQNLKNYPTNNKQKKNVSKGNKQRKHLIDQFTCVWINFDLLILKCPSAAALLCMNVHIHAEKYLFRAKYTTVNYVKSVLVLAFYLSWKRDVPFLK